MESTDTSQSISPAASASAWAVRSIRSKVPSAAHLRERVWSVAHGPYRSGTSRQAVPVLNFHTIPFRGFAGHPAASALATAQAATPGPARTPGSRSQQITAHGLRRGGAQAIAEACGDPTKQARWKPGSAVVKRGYLDRAQSRAENPWLRVQAKRREKPM